MESERFELSIEQREMLFRSTNERSDRIFQKFLIGSFLLGFVLAAIYDTWFVAIGIGGLSVAAFYLSKLLLPESKLYQYVGSAIMAVFMAQYIYQMHGLFEMHFFAFATCTVMITYSNWRLQIPLFVIIVLHHAVFAYLQFIGVEGIFFTQLPYMDLSTFILHAGLAGLIIFICGLWGYHSEKKILNDGIRALKAESALAVNLDIAHKIREGNFESDMDTWSQDPLSIALLEMRTSLKENADREELERYSNQGISIVSRLLAEVNTLEQGLMPDLILIDIMKPEMDGIEAIKRIRKDPQISNIPTIAITAKAMTGDRGKCISAGATEYLTKPMDTDLLLRTMSQCLEE